MGSKQRFDQLKEQYEQQRLSIVGQQLVEAKALWEEHNAGPCLSCREARAGMGAACPTGEKYAQNFIRLADEYRSLRLSAAS